MQALKTKPANLMLGHVQYSHIPKKQVVVNVSSYCFSTLSNLYYSLEDLQVMQDVENQE